jgi:hypothetical protein
MCTSVLGKQVFIGGVCGAKNYADKKKGYAKQQILGGLCRCFTSLLSLVLFFGFFSFVHEREAESSIALNFLSTFGFPPLRLFKESSAAVSRLVPHTKEKKKENKKSHTNNTTSEEEKKKKKRTIRTVGECKDGF